MSARNTRTANPSPEIGTADSMTWINAMTRSGLAWFQGTQEWDQQMIDYIHDSMAQAEAHAEKIIATRDPMTLAALNLDFATAKWSAMTDQALALSRIGAKTGENMGQPLLEALDSSPSKTSA